MRKDSVFLLTLAIFAVVLGCRDEGPVPTPVGIMWGSGANGVMVKDTLSLAVFHHDQAGRPLGGEKPLVQWTSANSNVLEILDDSLAIALDTGVTVLRGVSHALSDTIEITVEVIPRWSGRLVWVRLPNDSSQPRIATKDDPSHEWTLLPDFGYPGNGTGNPDISSDGGRIAAAATRPVSPLAPLTIYVLDVNTNTTTTPVQTLPGDQFFPVCYPGDSLLGFLTATASGHEVFTVRPDGTDLHQRTTFRQAVPPSFDFTPEGNLILELRFVSGATSDLYEASLDGDTLHRVTSETGDELLVTVSPDGSFLAYTKNNHVWISDRSGANAHRLLPNVTAPSGSAPVFDEFSAGSIAPSWTADGEFVLLSWAVDAYVFQGGNRYQVRDELYAVRIADGLRIRLTRSSTYNQRPRFR